MKGGNLHSIVRSAVIVSVLLMSACASRQVRCGRHLVPINVHSAKPDSRASK